MPFVNLDVAWSGITAELEPDGKAVRVVWLAKPGVGPAIYQGLVRGSVAGSPVEFLNFPAAPSEATTGRYDVTSGMGRADSVNVVIKYWKPGDSFAGAGYYGQSKPVLPRAAR